MTTLIDNEIKPERAFFIGIKNSEISETEANSLLRELVSLASTQGILEAGRMLVSLRQINSATMLGSGKLQEIINAAKDDNATSIIFDITLSPVQQRNIEHEAGISVYDRQELIIDIFASRARTKEAALQVELAHLMYIKPRLAHSYGDLHRQRGGRYGTKGSGEQKIELDRRLIEERINNIETELIRVEKARACQKKKRERIPLKRAAIVGYTNAGKSSILNVIAKKADVLAEDKLFATLDPTTRQLETKHGSILLTDTVGFIRNLPHGLVKAFKSTLEEASDADLLLYVLDASDPEFNIHFETTKQVLEEIGAEDIPYIVIYNKIDKASDRAAIIADSARHQNSVLVSAKTKEGLENLTSLIEEIFSLSYKKMILQIPHDKYALVSLLYREAKVESEQSEDNYTVVTAYIPDRLQSQYSIYCN